jgi:hypothetical protein
MTDLLSCIVAWCGLHESGHEEALKTSTGNNGRVCSELKHMVPLDFLSGPKRQLLLGMKFWE